MSGTPAARPAGAAASPTAPAKGEWPIVRLGQVLSHRKEFIRIDDTREYLRCRVQLHAKGIVLRDRVDGALIKTKEQQICRAGEFLVAEIDAKVGGFGVVPPELDGSIVSSHYFLFTVNGDRLDQQFLDYYSKTPAFRDQVRAQGSTNYAAIRPQHVLAYTIPLPPLPEQRRIVVKLDQLSAKQEEARDLRKRANAKTEATGAAFLNQIIGRPESGPLTQWCPLGELVHDVADGPHVTPTYVDQGVPFLTVLNITSGRIDFRNHKCISEADHQLFQRRARADKGDVLLSKDGTIGLPCLVDTDREFSFFVSVALIKPRRDALLGDFLAWTLRAPALQDRIEARSRGDMIRHLVLREIRALPVPRLSLDAQRGIVARIEEMSARLDVLGAAQAQTAAELDALIPAALDRAFKGHL